MNTHLQSTRHDYLRYANCWEDADLLLEALGPTAGDRILSIGSAGDNSFSLLVGQPDAVVAVDINYAQLQLIELKKAAFKALRHDQFLEFLGFLPSTKRQLYFEALEPYLSKESISYWQEQLPQILAGIIHQGKFERYFQFFHKWILPLIHSKKNIQRLLALKSEEEQAAYYWKTWNNRRWRWLFRVFFSKFILGTFGRDPKFLVEVEVEVSDFIFKRAEGHLVSTYCQTNGFLWYILTGSFHHHLPHYARKENFTAIKQHVDRLVLVRGLAEAGLEHLGRCTAFNLSNIFEYMPPTLFSTVTHQLESGSTPTARYVYWNLMVTRNMTTVSPTLEDHSVPDWRKKDKGFFYGNMYLTRRK